MHHVIPDGMIESKKSLCTCIDHCRIGSLEMKLAPNTVGKLDHCRIGSLETPAFGFVKELFGSLPHRQLRNIGLGVTNAVDLITAA